MGAFAIGSKVKVIEEGDELRPADLRQETGVIGTITQNITAISPRTIDQAIIQRQDLGGWIIAPNDTTHLASST